MKFKWLVSSAISANNALCEGAKVSIRPQPTVIHLSSIKNNPPLLLSTAFHWLEEANLAWATMQQITQLQ